MRMSLARPRTTCRHVLLGVVLVIAVSGCYVYERPAPGYYGGAVAVAPPAPRVIAEPPPREVTGFGMETGTSGPDNAG
jgi:hypothetical protein